MNHTILFDLDGTLTDPGEGITNSVAYALNTYGIEVADKTTLYPFIGPPLHESFMRFYGFSEPQALEAVERYRQYFSPKGIFENKVYPGLPELLERLVKEGFTLCLATSKPRVFAEQILTHFDLSRFFSVVQGSELDGTRVRKADVIQWVIAQLRARKISSAVMVGDREYDVSGAKENGLDCIGVTFGYGSKEELMQAGAVASADNAEELYQTIRDYFTTHQ